MATSAFGQSRGSNEGSKEWIGPVKLDSLPNVESKPPKSRLEFGSRGHRNTIAVGDVDGRAFDILLRSVSLYGPGANPIKLFTP